MLNSPKGWQIVCREGRSPRARARWDAQGERISKGWERTCNNTQARNNTRKRSVHGRHCAAHGASRKPSADAASDQCLPAARDACARAERAASARNAQAARQP